MWAMLRYIEPPSFPDEVPATLVDFTLILFAHTEKYGWKMRREDEHSLKERAGVTGCDAAALGSHAGPARTAPAGSALVRKRHAV